MIDYVNYRFNVWREWRLRGRDNGLGYPRMCNFMRLTPASGGGFQPTLNEDAWEIEQCIARLEPDEQRLIELYYVTTSLSAEQIAKEMRVCRDTVYTRLHRVHNKTLGWLNDLAAGVPLPPVRAVRKLEQVRQWRVR